MNLTKFDQSIYPNKCLFYEDVKQFTKVYYVNAEDTSKFFLRQFLVLQYYDILTVILFCMGGSKGSTVL